MADREAAKKKVKAAGLSWPKFAGLMDAGKATLASINDCDNKEELEEYLRTVSPPHEGT